MAIEALVRITIPEEEDYYENERPPVMPTDIKYALRWLADKYSCFVNVVEQREVNFAYEVAEKEGYN